MNTRATYPQQAAAWLNLLAPWWRVFGRGTAIKEIEGILELAEGETLAARTIFEAEYTRHQDTKKKFQDACRQLEAEQVQHRTTRDQLNTVRDKLDLITSILGAANQEHPKYLTFRKLFREDFLRFANEENFYKRGAEAILRMQAIEGELRLLDRVPLFRNKTIVAVAGGFSSGKSSLISSFFEPRFKVTLPIAMEPTTAIPTYIVHSTETAIIGFPAHGGTMEIAPELFAQMRHEFLQSLGFDLRRILPFIMLKTPWRKPWGSLCFIDTPGYNPAKGGGTTATDDTTTAEALRQADALLWVLGIDANGEISSEDVAYLQTHCSELPLAIVVNKADSRPPNQVREVVEQIRDTLDAYCIQYYCISAYSCVERREYDYVGQSLYEVLGGWNKPTLRDKRLSDEVNAVLNAYIKAFNDEIKAYKSHNNELHSLKLDLDELGLFDETMESFATRKNESSRGDIFSLIDKNLMVDTVENAVIENSRQHEIKEKALERLQNLANRFTIENIEALKNEAERLRKLFTELLAEDW